MGESIAVEDHCEHHWQYNKPAHASASVRICAFCRTIDGQELMRTLDKYAHEQIAKLKQEPAPMARIQILELPTISLGDDAYETPFAVIVDQCSSVPDVNGVLNVSWERFAKNVGARALMVTPDTVEIPANEVPVNPGFEQFREQVQQEIAKAQADMMNSLKRGRP
ncbi:hypothetical protein ADK70_12460 [Streptomyces rimosus subsp. pseudoverticillatus]|uniref:hypothetical protein n=1 Tax=Streptomyces rimosus TaxID=1927 RepID=UPI0006B26499|nr:hypothetical protein [Streptomyces rimosus]KOT94485.1 hypothetical protein ADK70_12460 [Streptomyces rimosus subsp. pseudoverticillatus]